MNVIKSDSVLFKHALKDFISTLLNDIEGGYIFKEKFDELFFSNGRATEIEVYMVLVGKVNNR